MYFLLNNQLLDIAAEVEDLATEAARERRQTPTLYKAVQIGQRLLYSAGSFDTANPAIVRRMSATIALASEANAALFVTALNATSARDVAVRLGSMPLTTVAYLHRLQERGPLTAGVINRDVWGQVAVDVPLKVEARA
ncbi:MAG TPA: hypothetical protein VG735_00105 [Caulobacterales bacterium]|nr:hypothetical protein [Caulobacterales bacterium]